MNNDQSSEKRDLSNTELLKVLLDSLIEPRRHALEELEYRWNNWPLDSSNIEVHEVIGGMIARQVSLLCSFIDMPTIWNPEVAPIFLRTMADNLITLNWVVKRPLERSQKFISHGIGIEKLQLERRKAQLEIDGQDPEKDPFLQASRAWINFHRFDFLTDVNVGSWSGISTREMAIQGDMKAFYDYVYDPFSSCAHNGWGHIGKYNLTFSNDPLHGELRQPFVPRLPIDPFWIQLAFKYTSRAFNRFDEAFSLGKGRQSVYDKYLEHCGDFVAQATHNLMEDILRNEEKND